MTLSPELMKAILSMDSYNRGYDAGIFLDCRITHAGEPDYGRQMSAIVIAP